MSKLTIIGDPHAKPNNLDLIEKLFDLVEDLGNTTVWLGDFLDTKEVIRGKCLNLIYRRLKKSKLNHIILVGNHDWFNLECQEHSLDLLKELDNVKVVDEPYQQFDCLFLPYIHDQKKLKNEISKYSKKESCKTLFAHLELKGFDFGNGHICPSGMTERSFSKFNRVISGHFHKFQQKGNLTYLGTPFSHSFGESNQTKYIGVLDLESDDLKLIETEFPKHITEVIDCDKCQDYDLSGYDPEDHIRIVLEGSQENINKTRSRSILESRYKFIERPTDDLKEGLQIEETLDNKVKFNTWARDIRKLDEATIELGISILEAVK